MRRYAYAWITLAFFLISFVLHWYFGWNSYVAEAAEHGNKPQMADYLNEMGRDTFENWQSEFLQLLWQVVGLAYFLYVGSPASKENDDRAEAKLDAIIRMVGGEEAEKLIADLDRHYMRTDGASPHGHDAELARTAGRHLSGVGRTG
jgi:hypothetical protein